MIVFFNGQFVPETEAKVSVFDRATIYGDGLFETVGVWDGRPFRWAEHLARLQRGADFLKIPLPGFANNLELCAAELIRRTRSINGLLRIQLSRGVGPRGYSPARATDPWLAMSMHPPPSLDANSTPQWRLMTSSFRLSADDPLTQFKTCNKLHQILARAEADASGLDEALLLNNHGHVAESTTANLFWMDGRTVCTPPLSSGALPGITRAVIFELCQELGVPCEERICLPPSLLSAAGVFLSLSSFGIVEAASLDGNQLSRAAWVKSLSSAYHARRLV